MEVKRDGFGPEVGLEGDPTPRSAATALGQPAQNPHSFHTVSITITKE